MQSKRRRQRGMTLLEMMIVLAILALVMGVIVGPRLIDYLTKSEGKIAKLAVRKLALEAYPQWRTQNPGRGCPSAIEELIEESEDAIDPWGNKYKLLCPPSLPPGAKSIAILSFGPDGKEGTDDDVRSWTTAPASP